MSSLQKYFAVCLSNGNLLRCGPKAGCVNKHLPLYITSQNVFVCHLTDALTYIT